jgi:hypothetical protein
MNMALFVPRLGFPADELTERLAAHKRWCRRLDSEQLRSLHR